MRKCYLAVGEETGEHRAVLPYLKFLHLIQVDALHFHIQSLSMCVYMDFTFINVKCLLSLLITCTFFRQIAVEGTFLLHDEQ